MNKLNFLKIKNFFPSLKLIDDEFYETYNQNYRFFICNRENVITETITIPSDKLETIFSKFSKNLPDIINSILVNTTYLHFDVNSILNDSISEFRFYIDVHDILLNNNFEFFENNYPLTSANPSLTDDYKSMIGFLINKNDQQLIYKYYVDDKKENNLKVYRFDSSKKFINKFVETTDSNVSFTKFNINNIDLINILNNNSFIKIHEVSRLNTNRKYLVIF